MYVGVIHTIRDADAWAEMMRSVGTADFPPGFELLATGTSRGADRAICLWQAPSVAQLQAVLDELAGRFAVTDCFAVSEEFTQVTGQDARAATT
ncbi:hypothetical protein SAMN05660642_01184 [Geodermatophilus siccatus]|uniref:DUF3303 domain-containing protein n=1 Tax=Geodermatophilus siccatus TaxID=1137991 RepID=A0A1G9NVS5_9ACTN|nr:hypothetical protein [Geodermatophilus siccatus]SDL90075.1 hypothetical protein SAMN05660642_01184 [Geodermatophilus siccatus]